MSGAAPARAVPPVLAALVGQPRAVETLSGSLAAPVHAYLFVGPPGSGRLDAARAFAAALLCPQGGCGECIHCRRALAGAHPDLIIVERTGASISVGEAREITRVAARTPVESDRKVLILTDFHLVDRAAPALLKTLEEPAASSVFVIVAEYVAPELVTIASRCVRVDFSPLAAGDVEAVLIGDGVDGGVAEAVAAVAGGRLDRARLLAADPGYAARRAAWQGVRDRLDGHGATVAVVVEELVDGLDAAVEPLRRLQAEEIATRAADAKARGERAGTPKEVEDRHRRELRRARTDELRAGLAALAAVYRPGLADADPAVARRSAEAVEAIDEAARALIRNPNETLLLQALLVRLGPGRP